MITHVETVAVYVSDQLRARDFYVDTLGFELRKDVPFSPADAAMRWIEVAPPKATTVLVLFTPRGSRTESVRTRAWSSSARTSGQPQRSSKSVATYK